MRLNHANLASAIGWQSQRWRSSNHRRRELIERLFYAQETEVGPQTEFDHNIVSTNILSKRRQGKYLSIVTSSLGNAVDQKICQRLPCPMTGLSGILGGTDGTVRVGIMGAGRPGPPARPGGGGGPRPGAVGA